MPAAIVKATAQPSTQRYWCAVACRDHVKRGQQGGFAQVCNGKMQPLARMKPGDGIVYYSPTAEFQSGEKCQKFTSIGLIKDDRVYQRQMSPQFVPFRRDIDYFKADDIPIRPLLPHLSFTRGRNSWGYYFRFGLFEIERDDFILILSRMNRAVCAKQFGRRACGVALSQSHEQ